MILQEPDGKGYFEDYGDYNEVVEGLQLQAIRDIRGEGFSSDRVVFRLELEMKFGGQVHVLRATSPHLRIDKPEEVKEICEAFCREFSDFYGAAAMFPEGGIEIRNFILHCIFPQHKIALPSYPMADKKVPRIAHKGEREVYWEEYGGFRKTPVFDQGQIKPGNVIDGPAIIECKDTNVVLEPGASTSVDKYLNLVIEKTL